MKTPNTTGKFFFYTGVFILFLIFFSVIWFTGYLVRDTYENTYLKAYEICKKTEEIYKLKAFEYLKPLLTEYCNITYQKMEENNMAIGLSFLRKGKEYHKLQDIIIQHLILQVIINSSLETAYVLSNNTQRYGDNIIIFIPKEDYLYYNKQLYSDDCLTPEETLTENQLRFMHLLGHDLYDKINKTLIHLKESSHKHYDREIDVSYAELRAAAKLKDILCLLQEKK